MRVRLLPLTGLCALAVALALPAGGLAATPTVTQVNGRDVGAFSICGLDLGYDFKFSGVEVVKTNGVTLDAGAFTSAWTNPATGKAITIHGASHGTNGAPVDNGDGTISFIQSGDGTYIVKATNGAPLSHSAGMSTARITIDAATGDLVSVELLSVAGTDSGPPADSSCDSIVAALT